MSNLPREVLLTLTEAFARADASPGRETEEYLKSFPEEALTRLADGSTLNTNQESPTAEENFPLALGAALHFANLKERKTMRETVRAPVGEVLEAVMRLGALAAIEQTRRAGLFEISRWPTPAELYGPDGGTLEYRPAGEEAVP